MKLTLLDRIQFHLQAQGFVPTRRARLAWKTGNLIAHLRHKLR